MFPQIPADLTSLSADELATLLTECSAAYAAARPDATTAEAVEALTQFAAAVGNVRAEQARRADTDPGDALSAEQAAALAALDADFSDTPPAEPDPDTDDADTEDGDEDEALSADQIADLIDARVTAALAASGGVRTRPRAASPETVAALAARPVLNPEQAPLPSGRGNPADWALTAGADVQGFAIGQTLTQRQVAEAMIRRSRDLGAGRGGPDDKVHVASFTIDRGDARTLSAGDYSTENDRKIREYREEREDTIVAAGGLCAPVDNRYEQMVVSQAWRPVMGGPVPTFTTARGGLKQVPPPSLADITAGVATVTAAADLTGGTGATKPCFTVTCANSTEDDIEADYVCMQFGNFGARTFPEQVEAWMQLAAAAHARLAEGNRLTDIKTKSVATTAAGLVGAGREILTRLEQQAQVINSSQRRPHDAPMEVIMPQWAISLIRADFTRTLTDDPDLIGVTDAEISAWLSARHLMVTLTPDSASGNSQVIAVQTAGVIKEYPTAVVADVFIPGTFLGLDGGELNLGLVRDSVLTNGSGGTAGNQFRMFYENFEALAKVGPAGTAAELTMSVCADGTYGAAKAVTCPIVT